MRRILPVLLLAFAISGAVACVRYVAVQSPDGPLAPPFNEQLVHGSMTDMAMRVRAIGLLLQDGPPSEAGRAEVIRLLGEIEHIAQGLAPEDIGATHPALAKNLEGFLADVRMAKRTVEAERPDYYLVGTLSGACAGCHGRDVMRTRPENGRRASAEELVWHGR